MYGRKFPQNKILADFFITNLIYSVQIEDKVTESEARIDNVTLPVTYKVSSLLL